MTLVLTLDQIAYIHKTAAANGKSLSEIGRDLMQAGIDASTESGGAPETDAEHDLVHRDRVEAVAS